jgi:hypothetical protein
MHIRAIGFILSDVMHLKIHFQENYSNDYRGTRVTGNGTAYFEKRVLILKEIKVISMFANSLSGSGGKTDIS